jgi:hypothetical protein
MLTIHRTAQECQNLAATFAKDALEAQERGDEGIAWAFMAKSAYYENEALEQMKIEDQMAEALAA